MENKTPAQLEYDLINDPNYVINMIIDNNADEVMDRIIKLEFGEDITTREDILRVVNYLIDNDKITELKYVLSVPLLADKIPTVYYPAIENATNQAYQRLLDLGIYAGNRPNPTLVENGMSI